MKFHVHVLKPNNRNGEVILNEELQLLLYSLHHLLSPGICVLFIVYASKQSQLVTIEVTPVQVRVWYCSKNNITADHTSTNAGTAGTTTATISVSSIICIRKSSVAAATTLFHDFSIDMTIAVTVCTTGCYCCYFRAT